MSDIILKYAILFEKAAYNSNTSAILGGLNAEFRVLVEQFLEKAEQKGINLVLTSGLRSIKAQEKLYQQGRTTPGGIVTKAKPGASKHNFGLAVDVAMVNSSGNVYFSKKRSDWDRIGEIGESVGLRWGGRFKSILDLPHFEMPRAIQDSDREPSTTKEQPIAKEPTAKGLETNGEQEYNKLMRYLLIQ